MAIIPETSIIESEPHLAALHTLEVTYEDGAIRRFAGKSININGSPYQGTLISVNPFRRNINGVIDRIDVDVSNLDYSHSLKILTNRPRNLSRAIVGQLFRDYLNNGVWIYQVLFRGVVGQPYTTTRIATYSVISDLAAAPLVGATAIVSRNCRWRYKDQHCASPSSAPTCDKTFHLSTGCKGRGPNPDSAGGNQFRFGGVNYDISKATIIYPPPPDPNGGGGGGGDGGGGGIFKDDGGGVPHPDYPY